MQNFNVVLMVIFILPYMLMLEEKQLRTQKAFLPGAFLMDDLEDYQEYCEEDTEQYPPDCHVTDIGEIDRLVHLLEGPIEGLGSLDIAILWKRLENKHIATLRFMAYSLKLGDMVQMPNEKDPQLAKTKAHLAEQLIQWVSEAVTPVSVY